MKKKKITKIKKIQLPTIREEIELIKIGIAKILYNQQQVVKGIIAIANRNGIRTTLKEINLEDIGNNNRHHFTFQDGSRPSDADTLKVKGGKN